MWHVLAGHECIILVHLSYRNSERTVAPPYLRFFDFANSQTEEAFGHTTWFDVCTRTRQFTERQGTCARSQVQTQVFGC